MTGEDFVGLCRDGDLAGVREALDTGADPIASVPFADGDTTVPISALYFACVGDHRDVVRLLLERGAEPNDGESVYHAAELNHRECLELLLAHGADVGGRSSTYHNTPLYFLSGYHGNNPKSATVALGMRWLLEHGADPNVWSGDERETPLHRCAGSGWAAVVELLLAHGADPAQERADGRTAYALAVRGGHTAVAGMLAARGGAGKPLSPADELLGACARGDESAAAAVLAKHPGLVASLGGDDRGAIVQVLSDNRPDAVRAFVRCGFDLAWEGPWGGTPLHHAAWHGSPQLTRMLLELGAPIDVRDSRFGSSPIGWAAHGSRHGREDDDAYAAVVTALLDAGASREPSINKWGEPPEAMASPRVVALLKERGFAP